jgi:hypothetical protein
MYIRRGISYSPLHDFSEQKNNIRIKKRIIIIFLTITLSGNSK